MNVIIKNNILITSVQDRSPAGQGCFRQTETFGKQRVSLFIYLTLIIFYHYNLNNLLYTFIREVHQKRKRWDYDGEDEDFSNRG